MNKNELVAAISGLLRENGIKKPIKIPKRVFTITDEDGESKSFAVKQNDKEVIYTAEDIRNILEAFVEVVKDNMRRGIETSIYGFGVFDVHYRAARATKRPDTGEWVDVAARYVPKFNFGKELRMAAKVYDMSVKEEATLQEALE